MNNLKISIIFSLIIILLLTNETNILAESVGKSIHMASNSTPSSVSLKSQETINSIPFTQDVHGVPTVTRNTYSANEESYYQKFLKLLKMKAQKELRYDLVKIIEESYTKNQYIDIKQSKKVNQSNVASKNEVTVTARTYITPVAATTPAPSTTYYFEEITFEEEVFINAGENIEIYQEIIDDSMNGSLANIIYFPEENYFDESLPYEWPFLETTVEDNYIKFNWQTETSTKPGRYYVYYPRHYLFQSFHVLPTNLQSIELLNNHPVESTVSLGNYRLYSFTPQTTTSHTIHNSNVNDIWMGLFEDVNLKKPILDINGFHDGIQYGSSAVNVQLTAGHTYYLLIYLIGGVNQAETTLSITTDIENVPPSAPSKLLITNRTFDSISLSWKASTDNVGVTSYKIYNGNSLLGVSSTTSFVVQNFAVNSLYALKVTAVDAAGNESQASKIIYMYTGNYHYYYEPSGKIDYIQLSTGQKLKYYFDANGSLIQVKLQ